MSSLNVGSALKRAADNKSAHTTESRSISPLSSLSSLPNIRDAYLELDGQFRDRTDPSKAKWRVSTETTIASLLDNTTNVDAKLEKIISIEILGKIQLPYYLMGPAFPEVQYLVGPALTSTKRLYLLIDEYKAQSYRRADGVRYHFCLTQEFRQTVPPFTFDEPVLTPLQFRVDPDQTGRTQYIFADPITPPPMITLRIFDDVTELFFTRDWFNTTYDYSDPTARFKFADPGDAVKITITPQEVTIGDIVSIENFYSTMFRPDMRPRDNNFAFFSTHGTVAMLAKADSFILTPWEKAKVETDINRTGDPNLPDIGTVMTTMTLTSPAVITVPNHQLTTGTFVVVNNFSYPANTTVEDNINKTPYFSITVLSPNTFSIPADLAGIATTTFATTTISVRLWRQRYIRFYNMSKAIRVHFKIRMLDSAISQPILSI